MFISRKHGKIEYTFFPLLLWQLISGARSGFRFTESIGQENSFAFKCKSGENISLCLAAILNLRNARVLFIMAKRHPVRNSQFMKVTSSFFQEEGFRIRSNHPVCLNFPLAYEYRKYVEN
jgi:hypothetical protein